MNQPVAPFAHSAQELEDLIREKIKPGQPTFFKLGAQLPAQGRTDTPMAATDKMAVVLKTYAAAGENELHAHINEDHTFVVLQGRARFFGPKGEMKTIGLHEGILLPANTLYWFQAEPGEQLVMLRVGCAANDDPDRLARIGGDGKPLDGFAHGNKQVELIMSDRWFGPTGS